MLTTIIIYDTSRFVKGFSKKREIFFLTGVPAKGVPLMQKIIGSIKNHIDKSFLNCYDNAVVSGC